VAKPAKPIGVAPDGAGQQVIGDAGERQRDIGREILRTRLGLGEHLHVDTGGIHLRQPKLAEIAQPFGRTKD